MYPSDIEIRPGIGWANVQLGSTLAEVRNALATNGHAYDLDDGEYSIDIHSPEITFYFNDEEPKRLVQIVFYDAEHRVDDQPVVGLTLAEGMLPFDVASYEDTLWSLVSIEEEYQQGKPLADSKRLTRSSGKQNLDCATLWILSQAVGLVMLDDHVHAIAIRKFGDVPTVGCGRLDSLTMKMALDAKPVTKPIAQQGPYPESLRIPRSQLNSSRSWRRPSGLVRWLFGLLAVACLAAPTFIVYRDLTAWSGALPVVGKVVETEHEGPFLETVILEYSLEGGETSHRVSIPATYTNAREKGAEEELLYLPHKPDRAMTRLQIRDEGFSISPYLLFGCIGLSTLFLHLAFPEYIRLTSKRKGVK